MTTAQRAADLRFGFAPLPAASPGYYPAGEAVALMLPGIASPATQAISGAQYTGSYAADQRYVLRVPDAWNGSLIVAGTPATRNEFSNDLIWGEFALARGYAFASSNKGIAVNALLDVAADVVDRRSAYPFPFDTGGLLTQGLALRMGVLSPRPVRIESWNADYRTLIGFTRDLLAQHHRLPERVYAVGLSNGGGQVRTLLEQHAELVDGGVDWSGVYWSRDHNLLEQLPAFLAEMPAYIASGFRDRAVVERLIERGFPPDVVQDDPARPSLYAEFYSNEPPFYADLTVFAYGLLIDPHADAWYSVPACDANPDDPARLPATCNGSGLAVPANRAAYVPSAAARTAIEAFAHTGDIGKPLVSIAGTHDAFVTPENHATRYARAVAQAGRSALHELYFVEGGTHVDTFAAFGYGLQAQAPFAWAAFDRLIHIVEGGATPNGAAAARNVRHPADIA